MKINIEFDISPAEFRDLLGLPEIGFFNDKTILQMQKMFKDGSDSFDTSDILTPMISQSFNNLSMFQNLMLQAMTNYSKNKNPAFNETKDASTKDTAIKANAEETQEEATEKPEATNKEEKKASIKK